MMDFDSMLAIIQAAKEGKRLQFRLATNPSGKWQDVGFFNAAFSYFDYRVTPEPREWTIRVYKDGSIFIDPQGPRPQWQGTPNDWDYTSIKVREVL